MLYHHLLLSGLEPRSFKYIGAGIAALYGIFATITDFHEEKNSRRVLSRKGYFGLALLAIASMMTISSDWSKDKNDDIAANQKRQIEEQRFAIAQAREDAITGQIDKNLEKSTQVSQNLATAQSDLKKSLAVVAKTSDITTELLALQQQSRDVTSSLLAEARRTNDPLKPKDMRLEVSISNVEVADTYLKRLVNEVSEEERKHPYEAIQGTEAWPSFAKADERGLFIFVSSVIQVGFTDAESLRRGAAPLLLIGSLCHKGSTRLAGFIPDSFEMYCGLANTKIGVNRANIISHVDLADKIAILVLIPPADADNYRADWSDLENVLPKRINAALRITESDEKVYIIDGTWVRCGRRDMTIYCHVMTVDDLKPKT
jgi:hypothetical protein